MKISRRDAETQGVDYFHPFGVNGFMSDLLKGIGAEVERLEAMSAKPTQEEIANAMMKRFTRKGA